jgi:hypothetical protein
MRDWCSLDASENGSDVFFLTSGQLVPQDTDSAGDIYDARIGGGFPETGLPPAWCVGDACQGPLSNPAPLLVPASATFSGPGNITSSSAGNGPGRGRARTKRTKRRRVRKAHREGARRRGSVSGVERGISEGGRGVGRERAGGWRSGLD